MTHQFTRPVRLALVSLSDHTRMDGWICQFCHLADETDLFHTTCTVTLRSCQPAVRHGTALHNLQGCQGKMSYAIYIITYTLIYVLLLPTQDSHMWLYSLLKKPNSPRLDITIMVKCFQPRQLSGLWADTLRNILKP